MEKLVTDKDFQKVDVCRTLFNRCTLEELTALHRLVEDGSVRRLVGKKFNNQEFKQIEAEIIISNTNTKLLTTKQL